MAIFYWYTKTGKGERVNKKLLVAIIALVLLAGGGVGAYALYGDTGTSNNFAMNTQQATEETKAQEADGEIRFSQNGETVTYSGRDDETALAVLESLTDMETEESEFGRFVTTINGVEASGDDAFWAFYVNGEKADKGAGNYKTESDDTIMWKLESVK